MRLTIENNNMVGIPINVIEAKEGEISLTKV